MSRQRQHLLLLLFLLGTLGWLIDRGPEGVLLPGVSPHPDGPSSPVAALVRGIKAPSPPSLLPGTQDSPGGVSLQQVTGGAEQPVGLVFAPGDPLSRLFVVEKGGIVRILQGGVLQKTPYLDLSDRVSGGGEQGLLGLAFHPRFAENGRLFVNYTDRKGDTRIVEFRAASKDAPSVSLDTAQERWFLDQPYANHNGGNLLFGPDGKLWVGTGDGGSGNDPHDNGQNPASLLGKMVRMDVDAPQVIPETVHTGLRNPWRYSFDRQTRDLYIADVGQNQWEEVSIAAKGSPSLNFGWAVVEGMNHCAKTPRCDASGLTPPVVEYSHAAGCSITGGFVYRGRALPSLKGHYFYSDFCSARVWSFRWDGKAAQDAWEWRSLGEKGGPALSQVSAFGEDGEGELYLLSLSGGIYKMVPSLRANP